METKKIVQIAVTNDTDGDPIIHALCDDGSLYVRKYFSSGPLWEPLPGITKDHIEIISRNDAILFAEEWNSDSRHKRKLKFIAQDRYGEWVGFCEKPEPDNERWDPNGKCLKGKLHILRVGKEEDWKETLTKIEA